jgi:hypothetical protein
MGCNLDYILKVFFQISATFPLLFTILLSSSSTSPLHLIYQQSIWYEAKCVAAHIISDSLYINSNTDDDDDDNNNNNNSTLYSVTTLRIFKEQAVNKKNLNNKEITVFWNVMPCNLVHGYECCFPSDKPHGITPSKPGRGWLCLLQYKSKFPMNRLFVFPTHCDFLQSLEGLDVSVLYKDSVRTAQYTLSTSVIQNQSANVVSGKSRCLFRDQHKTLNVKRAPCTIL